MAREKGVLTGRVTVIAEDGYSIICIGEYIEGMFFGSTYPVSIEPGALSGSLRFNVTVPEGPRKGVILLKLGNANSPSHKTSFVKISTDSKGAMHIGLLYSDEEWLPPAHKQFQMCDDGKGFRFLMKEIWYTTNPKEKRKYPYVPPSNGNLICEYLFEEDATKESELAEKLWQVALEYEAEESELERLQKALTLEREEKSLLTSERYTLLSGIDSIGRLILDESRSRGNKFRVLKTNESMQSLIQKIDEEVHELLPKDYGWGGCGDAL